jgi:hypothetical protein
MHAELKALRAYAPPRYPTRALVEAEPALLARAIPRRWQGSSRIAAALAAAVFGLGGGSALAAEGQAAPASPPPKPTPTPTAAARPVATAEAVSPAAGSADRPVTKVFCPEPGRKMPGGGRSCSMVMYCGGGPPPEYLSEEEARAVILDEFARLGLKFEADRETIPGVLQRRESVRRYDRESDQEVTVIEEARDPPADLVLDGWDAEQRIGFEYISPADYAEAGGVGTADAGNYHDAAEYMARRLSARSEPQAIGVFWATQRRRPEDLEVAREDIRGHVREFAEWLQAQGLLR